MSRRRRVVSWVGGLLALAVVALIVFAPSWRNYYLRRGAVRIIEDRAYLAGSDNPKHRLDLYLPTTNARPWPVVVFVHGGFWRPMDRRLFQPFTGLFGAVGVALAKRGVATAVVSYRQRPEAATIQDALDDVAHAVHYVMGNIARDGGDPRRVFVVGHSAGGLMTALLAVEPEHLARAGVAPGSVRGFAMLAAPYDLARLTTFLDAGMAERVRQSVPSARDVERYSPERHVRADHPPMLLLVGNDDVPGMVEEQRHMGAVLRSTGGDATSVELPGEGHMALVMHLSRPGDRALDALTRFIARHP